jgi:alginate O-acetyltransferase complex protein AlgJ
MRRAKQSIQIIFLCILGLAMAFSCLNINLRLIPDLKNRENRTLAKFPVFDINYLDRYPKAYDHWLNDHFSLRNFILLEKMTFEINILDQSPIPDFVIIGKKGWLYNSIAELDEFNMRGSYLPGQLKIMKNCLLRRKKFMEEHHANWMIAIAPIKYTVYPEYLPATVMRGLVNRKTKQFLSYMQNEGIQIVDLSDTIIQSKQGDRPLFFKTDTHWNSNGAFYAYAKVMQLLRREIPSLEKALDQSDYVVTETNKTDGNINNMIGALGKFSDVDFIYTRKSPDLVHRIAKKEYTPPVYFPFPESYETRYTNGNPKSPKILIIGDSFAAYIAQFLKQHFSETTVIFDSWRYKLNPEIIEKEKPDIVLYLIIESNLGRTWIEHPND